MTSSSTEHGSLGKHYKLGPERDRDPVGRTDQHHVSSCIPPYKVQHPRSGRLGWEYVNYAPVLVIGAFILFGGWYVLSARKWFKGPVRMGTEEGLGHLEEQTLGQYALPTERT